MMNSWENPVDVEIRQDLAGLLHDIGFTPEELTGPDVTRLGVIIPTSRAVILQAAEDQPFDYYMVLTNDALSKHVAGDDWLKVLEELTVLRQGDAATEL